MGETTARTESDLPIQSVYSADDLAAFDAATKLGEPGKYPFTRGVYPTMYHGQAVDDAPVRRLRHREGEQRALPPAAPAGTGGLSVAFDLPTQMGYDSDAPLASGEVGKVGVAIDSIDDMKVLFDGLPLDKVSTSMTINAPASTLLLMYELVAESRASPPTS
jgi:methylmalonyl-CoA mutase N-terminal domain/subunit